MSQSTSQSGEPEKLKMPEDTNVPSADDTAGGSKGGSKSGTSMDTILGRLVVEQGFATRTEVRQVIDEHKGLEDPSEGSLAELLVKRDCITERQLDRLRTLLEAERSGQQIPGFKVLGKLGAGAMATVFKAKQISLDRTVAIKVLPRRFSQNPEFISRFYAEGRAAAQLNHPNIVQAYDVGHAGEYHYFVMEYVEGSTVFDQIVRHKRYAERDALDIAIQIAEALQHAHEKGLIHRDVKPKNIMIAREGVAKLADMGLAREITDKDAAEAEAGKAYGTPYYISPEQIRGIKDITPAADIYSLGATLYHMVTGAVPFEGKSPSDVMHKHLKAELAPPDHVNPKLSAGFSQIIEMMMEKAPKARYQSCRDLLTDLYAVRNGDQPVIAHADVSGDQLKDLAAAAEEASSGDIPIDRFREPSPFSHPIVQIIVAIFVVSVIVNVLQLIVFLMQA